MLAATAETLQAEIIKVNVDEVGSNDKPIAIITTTVIICTLEYI